MMNKQVHYEIWLNNSKAAKLRLINALITFRGQLLKTFLQGATIVAIVKLAPDDEETFKFATKVGGCKYRSPTDFHNGTIYPIYKSPQEELNGSSK